ncbi:uridine kinase family protein [Auraticoccus monumenti]|uniref:uridine kinase family protein n=1 Tax=Auraticoccus monumenti TaxID=675864 RepID=UPI0018D36499|nr:hypothetical protein [Auraticoccus monumenti]
MVTTWAEVDVATLLRVLGLPRPDRTAVVAVDGRSGAGKSTLTARLVAAVPGSAVVATDDVAWHSSMFGWAEDLRTSVVEPVLRGERVRHRPPGWVERGRPGAVTVEAGRSVLLVEGVGASQRVLADVLDAAVWVQSDVGAAFALGIERDVASGVNGDRDASVAFWHAWAVAEEPFLEADQPWQRADAVVAGVPLARRDGLLWRPPPSPASSPGSRA